MSVTRLFIGDREVEFTESPAINYNWTETDVTNPTVTKVGFSKTIRIPGTKNNNDIFGHFWDLERWQEYGGSSAGSDFNPTSRVPFTLLYNDAVFETGYVKLQNVTRKSGDYQYEVGLFGGLGSFLYGLSINADGTKKTLADLSYFAGNQELELDYTINKETVLEAWSGIDNASSKWSTLNFAPGYVGIPDKLDADKVLINFNGMSASTLDILPDDVSGYTSYNGYALGKLDNKIDQWAAKDLRSYLNIPVIRTKSVINAITREENNGGYEVDLDSDFFNSDNPAFEDSWMTLPKMTTLNFNYTSSSGDTPVITAYTVSRNTTYTNSDGAYIYATTLDYLLPSATTTAGISASVDLNMLVKVNRDSDKPTNHTLYLNNGKVIWGRGGQQTLYGPKNCIAVQLVAFDENNAAIGSSDVIWCKGTNFEGPDPYDNVDVPTFNYEDANYSPFINAAYSPFSGDFTYVSSASTYSLYAYPTVPVEFYVPIGTKKICLDIQFVPDNRWYPTQVIGTYSTPRRGNELYTNPGDGTNIYRYWAAFDDRTTADIDLFVQGDVNNFFSNRKVLKSELLNTSYSVADWLMSYCKLHGLYIVKDPVEKKVSILTRPNFYHDEVEDISKLVDYIQDVNIKPVYTDRKFLTMTLPIQENTYSKAYKNKYKYEYGEKVVDTGYDFETEPKELLDKSQFKGAVPVNKQSLYHFKPKDGVNPYVYNGLEYNLYLSGVYSGETKDIAVQKEQISKIFTGYEYTPGLPAFDSHYKMYFENDDKGISTENVLLFYNGKKSVTDCGYYLTDDITMMNTMNNNPCWILTNSNVDKSGIQIASKVYMLPSFTSMFFDSTGRVKRSAYFGSPRELYTAPGEVNFNAKSTLYEWYYNRYMADLYDVNTKVVTAYVKPKTILSADHLRHFYWFENGIWRINKISDYTPGSEDPVKVEFIKVQDIANYRTIGFKTPRVISVDLDFQPAEKITPTMAISPTAITIQALSTSAVTATSDSLSPIRFTSSNTGIATVSGGGASGSSTATVSGVSSGNTTVTAYVAENPLYKSGSTMTNVTVTPIPGTISISPNPMNAIVGEDATFTVQKNSTATPTWSSSNTSVATVSGGTVSGVGVGSCTITATLPAVPGVYTSATTTASVVVKKRPRVESINLAFTPAEKQTPTLTISPTAVTTNALGTVSITGTCNSSGNIRFASSDTGKARVSFTSASGTCVCTISGVSSGNTTVTAYVDSDPLYKSGSTTCSVTITPNTSTLSLSPSPASVHVGGTQQITATTNSTGTITWSSSNPSVVSVNSSGLASGVSNGSATITATLAAVPGVWTSGSASVSVSTSRVPSVTSISLVLTPVEKQTPTISLPSSISLSALGTSGVTATSNSSSVIQFISSNTGIATVSSTPVSGSCSATVSGVSSGSTTITAYVSENSLYKSGSTTCNVTVNPITGTISVSPTAMTIHTGSMGHFTATKNSTAQVQWSSSNTSIATVSNGNVSCFTPGNVVITAYIPAVPGIYTSASTTANVSSRVAPSVSSISLTLVATKDPNLVVTPASSTITYGQTKQLSATKSTPASITWSSNNTSVATVNQSGLVTSSSSGTTAIKASVAASGEYAAGEKTVTVTVNPITTTLTVTPSPAAVTKNNTVTLTATTNSPCGVTWSSDNTAVATVNSSGVVTGIAPGTANIYAEVPVYAGRYTRAYANTTVTVSNNPTPTITINPTAATIYFNGTKQLTGSSQSSETIQWSSSNTAAATVSSSGLVSGVASGTTIITAYVPEVPGTWAPASTTATITVNPITGTASVSPSQTTIRVGSWITLTGSTNSTATGTWSSANPSIARISSNSTVVGVATGTTTITYSVPAVSGKYTAASATCTVTVIPALIRPTVSSISLTLTPAAKSTPTLTISTGTTTMNALSTKTISASSNSDAKINFISSNTGIATVSSTPATGSTSCVISGVASGTTTITAYVAESQYYSSASTTCTVTVSPVTGTITVSPGSATIRVGATTGLTATKNSTATVSWTSSNTSVATVNSSGRVTGVSRGSATITASIPAVPGVYTSGSTTSSITVLKTPSITSISLTKN